MDSEPLPRPPAEVLTFLHHAAEMTDDVDQETAIRKVLAALSAPSMPTPREVAAALTANSYLGPPVTHSAGAVVFAATSSMTASASVVSPDMVVDGIDQSRRYAALVAAWGGAALVIAKVIDQASETAIRWIELRGH